MADKKFRFWFPIDEMKKGTDESGEVEMKFGGYASTMRKDVDGENLDPSGFDLSYFNERGIVNWNHGKTPETIIGEPIEAKIIGKKLWVSTKLYNRSELAKGVYALGETLEQSGATRRLGYSIEGIVTERDPNNPTKVKKAMITNMAITLNPKNPDSIIDIIKGTFNEFDDSVDTSADELLKQVSNGGANGGTQYIIDITRPDGCRVVVDKDYQIKITKALDTINGKPLIKEDLDNKLVDLNKVSSKKDYLSKAQIMEKIFSKFGVIDLLNANKIFNKINSTMKKNQKNSELANITEEVLEKALGKMSDSLSDDILNKNMKNDEAEEEVDPNDAIETDENEEEEYEEKPKPKAKAKPKAKPEMNDNMEKGSLSESLAIVLKGLNDKINKFNEKFDALEKSLDSQAELLNEIADSAPAPKSITKSNSKPLGRSFEKGIEDEFEKGVNGEESEKTLSVSKQKGAVLSVLDNLAFGAKGFNPTIAKAMTTFESSGTLEKAIVDEIKTSTGIQLVN
jgi:hypothetical protein